jgi:hypothetical protein
VADAQSEYLLYINGMSYLNEIKKLVSYVHPVRTPRPGTLNVAGILRVSCFLRKSWNVRRIEDDNTDGASQTDMEWEGKV